MDWKSLSTVFTSVFIAELGDKTQLATMLFASDKDASKFTVFAGAALALIVTSALGVAAGSAMSHIRERRNFALSGGDWVYRYRHLDLDQSRKRGVTMSKYLMNKLIHHVNMNESAEDEYVE